jgi:HD-like signal output (HDOD) protein
MIEDDDAGPSRQSDAEQSSALSDFLLIERINQCPKLASLKSINDTLIDLLDSEVSFVAQIAEVIRLDPSLTTRVLDLVNSIFFGSKDEKRITGVEEASIFLGLNRISELISATPVIEEIMELGKNSQSFPWTDFWRHSIGCAILTREILSLTDEKFEDEADYVAGLLHNLGKLILAITFPDLFSKIYQQTHQESKDLLITERNIVGWDHAKIGAYYLWNHHISDEVVEAVHWHHEPSRSETHSKLASAIQVADFITTKLGVTGLDRYTKQESRKQSQLDGWKILFAEKDESEMKAIEENLESSVERISQTLRGIL